MSENNKKINIEQVAKLVSVGLGISGFELIGELWKLGKKIIKGLSNEGMYEVLEYETTLELHDSEGKKASLRKYMKIRYLQDDIIAFQDYAWGDGEILLDYLTSRGKAVDIYRSGYKSYILLSLREVRNRGDIDEFNISWGIRNGFLTPDGFWSTTVSHRMKQLKVNIIFPRSRLPQKLVLEESNRRRTYVLGKECQSQLPDGRWQISWNTMKPKLYEIYTIRWEW
ncbi:MAG: hypothetical protein PVF83_14105 [Anaerolineales bacterium]|jgi:hypothetical protein